MSFIGYVIRVGIDVDANVFLQMRIHDSLIFYDVSIARTQMVFAKQANSERMHGTS